MKSWAVCFALGTAVALPGCDRGASAPEPPQTIVVAAPSDLRTLNPLLDVDANTHQLLVHALFLPLIRLDDSLRYAPGLAESWNWSGDSAITFSLRRDVKWHDGRPSTAHDVAFTFNRMKDDRTGYPTPEYFEQWQSVQVVDSFTARFRVRPHAEPLIGWTLAPIVPAHLLDSIQPERLHESSFNTNPVGNGPFKFASHAGNQWVFVANDQFPDALGGAPKIARLVWRIIPDNAAQISELRSGGADIILSPRAEQARALDADTALRTLITPSRRYLVIGWNSKRPTLRDPRVRRALAMALNRTQMLQVVRGGYGEVGATPIAPFQSMHDKSITPLAYDTAGARALLDSVGLNRPATIELKIPANNQFNADVAELIRADLARVGVLVKIRQTEFSTLIEDISSPARRFDAVLMGFEADYRPDFRDLFHSRNLRGPMQMASYSDAHTDRLLDSLASIVDRAAAQPLWSELQRKLRDDQPWTVLWFAPDIITVRERVKGVDADIRGLLVNVTRWRVEP